jgi:hypothetical protein
MRGFEPIAPSVATRRLWTTAPATLRLKRPAASPLHQGRAGVYRGEAAAHGFHLPSRVRPCIQRSRLSNPVRKTKPGACPRAIGPQVLPIDER